MPDYHQSTVDTTAALSPPSCCRFPLELISFGRSSVPPSANMGAVHGHGSERLTEGEIVKYKIYTLRQLLVVLLVTIAEHLCRRLPTDREKRWKLSRSLEFSTRRRVNRRRRVLPDKYSTQTAAAIEFHAKVEEINKTNGDHSHSEWTYNSIISIDDRSRGMADVNIGEKRGFPSIATQYLPKLIICGLVHDTESMEGPPNNIPRRWWIRNYHFYLLSISMDQQIIRMREIFNIFTDM